MAPRRAVLCAALAVMLALAAASPLPTSGPLDFAVRSASVAHKLGWTAVAKADPEHSLHLVLALRQSCTSQDLEKVLTAVSDPDSVLYGEYMSLDEVTKLVAAPDAAIDTVTAWLLAGGAQLHNVKLATTRDILEADVSVAVMETLMAGASMQHWEHPSRPGYTIVRSATGKVVLPAEVEAVLDAIEGVFDFPSPPRSRYAHERMHKAALAGAATPGNAPTLGLTVGVDSAIGVGIIPKCYNGDMPSKDMPLCGSNAPAVSGFTIVAQQQGDHAPITVDLEIDAKTCSYQSMGGFWMCQNSIGGLPNYQNFSLTVTTNFANKSTSAAAHSAYDALTQAWVTPDAIARMYNIPEGATADAPGNGQAVIEFDLQYYSPSDLSTFVDLVSLPQPNVVVIGPNNGSDSGGEATLDVQLVTSVGQGTTTTFWSFGQGYLLTYLAALSSDASPPLVNSISYGNPEKLSDVATMVRTNAELMKAGIRGITIISTAGDLGVSDGVNCTQFYADFPSSSPYTTSLGATRQARMSNEKICGLTFNGAVPFYCADYAEAPCALNAGAGFTTGGMFSDVFEVPSYQADVVAAYLKNTAGPTRGNYNSSGRGYNDVAAFGNNILVVQNGVMQVSGGTSASGPIFAGVVALLNGARLRASMPSLGFANPLLYKLAAAHPAAFNTVTGGNNQCGEQQCCAFGLPGTTDGSWSPLGGLGSPNVGQLLQLVTANSK